MSIISVRDNENRRWKSNTQKNTHKKTRTKAEKSKGDKTYSERVRAKLFCCAFKLGFSQLICEASLIFKSNLELALSIILKQRQLFELKHASVECWCLKIWDLLSFFVLLNLSFQITTSFANIARTTASTGKFIY